MGDAHVVVVVAGHGPGFRTDPSQLVLHAGEIHGTSMLRLKSEGMEPWTG